MKTWPTTGTVPPTGGRAGGGPPQPGAMRVRQSATQASLMRSLRALYARGGKNGQEAWVALQQQHRYHLGVRGGGAVAVGHRHADREALRQDDDVRVADTERALTRHGAGGNTPVAPIDPVRPRPVVVGIAETRAERVQQTGHR